ncbi:MAG: hypothetical protein GX030_09200 [Firmicutes bacterium]|nr:hypothetical protein [Bacillota bacterium]
MRMGYMKLIALAAIWCLIGTVAAAAGGPISPLGEGGGELQWAYRDERLGIDLEVTSGGDEVILTFLRLGDGSYNFKYRLEEITSSSPTSLLLAAVRGAPFREFSLGQDFHIQLNNGQPQRQQVRFRLESTPGETAREYQFLLRLSHQNMEKGLPEIRLWLGTPKVSQIQVTPTQVAFSADGGPGVYPLAQAVQVEVTTNYTGWHLKVTGEPLVYQGPESSPSGKAPSIPRDRLLLAVGEHQEPQPIGDEGLYLIRNSKKNNASITVYLYLKSVLTDPAGRYEQGRINFSLVDPGQ